MTDEFASAAAQVIPVLSLGLVLEMNYYARQLRQVFEWQRDVEIRLDRAVRYIRERLKESADTVQDAESGPMRSGQRGGQVEQQQLKQAIQELRELDQFARTEVPLSSRIAKRRYHASHAAARASLVLMAVMGIVAGSGIIYEYQCLAFLAGGTQSVDVRVILIQILLSGLLIIMLPVFIRLIELHSYLRDTAKATKWPAFERQMGEESRFVSDE